ncbi:hypothetical protein B0T24DRAFT_321289 [Lasiosphaeria ovina]|uniref:Secreted protein n=1 Tax=Lasiosphaeria ovina TaxID=92902 RepID=A0AAE0K7T5_9PEZI|nr:hypothetical protein B0T24DRAFT_321289 [Lasiosphaeria ovina]
MFLRSPPLSLSLSLSFSGSLCVCVCSRLLAPIPPPNNLPAPFLSAPPPLFSGRVSYVSSFRPCTCLLVPQQLTKNPEDSFAVWHSTAQHSTVC